MKIVFTKLEGNGNDFVLIDEYEHEKIPEELKGNFASLYCDRRFGIGCDGVLYLSGSETENLKMRLFQPDESEAEMCGNGIRCLAKYAYDMGYVDTIFSVETPAGSMKVSVESNEDGLFLADVTMTKPVFERAGIPATGTGEYNETISKYNVFAVNTGVPHAVVFVDSLKEIDIASEAPLIRNHKTFPNGTNVNFVEIKGKDEISIRTFERGVEKETLSCGTGATASAAIANKLGKTGNIVNVETVGGPLTITLGEEVIMKGPAETVFTGFIEF